MKKSIIFYILFLLLSTISYGSVIHISDEEELKNIFDTFSLSMSTPTINISTPTISMSTPTQDILVISPFLLENLSDENKEAIKKLYSEKKCEFAGTTYVEVILPVLINEKLEDDAKQQIEKGKKIYYEIFEGEPTIFYPYLEIISSDSVEMIKQLNYSAIVTSHSIKIDLCNEISTTSFDLSRDLSRWSGAPVQTLAWNYIKQAKLKLAEYINSESYNIEKFNTALEELYSLEKPIWFENYISRDANTKKENDLWFRAGISNLYRVIGRESPSSISIPLYNLESHDLIANNTTTDKYVVYFTDDFANNGDTYLSSSTQASPPMSLSDCNLSAFGIKKSTGGIIFDIFVSSITNEIIDIYIDLNEKDGIGNTSFLAGHNGFTDSISAWEYAISVSSFNAKFCRYSRTGLPIKPKTFTINNFPDENLIELILPENYILGNPKKWGYIVAGFLPSGDIFNIVGRDIPIGETIIQIPALRLE
ncbi:MAG: glucodextranase DOMON-like domain-containing protein [Elusimicrobiota bacterium]